MINENTITDMETIADRNSESAAGAYSAGLLGATRMREELASDYRRLAEVARLLNTDARLRDALAEARDRAADARRGTPADIQSPECAAGGHGGCARILADAVPCACTCHARATAGTWTPADTDEPDTTPPDGTPGTCATCGQPMRYADCPTGGWWAHETHPADDHDAALGGIA